MDRTSETTTQAEGEAAGRHPAVGYALLFAVPILVGVTVMMTKVTGGRPLWLVLAPGLVLGGCVFLLVVAATRGGYDS